MLQKVRRDGRTLSCRDQELTLVRDGAPHAPWMNLDYSPAFDESGTIPGVVAIVIETTRRVLAERRAASEHERVDAERVQLALGAGAIIAPGSGIWRSDRFTIDEAFARNFGIDPALG